MGDNVRKAAEKLKPQSLGVYLALVFEFIGTLGFSGLVAYALQRWVWPEQGPLVFLFTMMVGLATGIWHIYLRMRGFSTETDVQHTPQKRVPTIQDGERSVEELRKMRRRLDDAGR